MKKITRRYLYFKKRTKEFLHYRKYVKLDSEDEFVAQILLTANTEGLLLDLFKTPDFRKKARQVFSRNNYNINGKS